MRLKPTHTATITRRDQVATPPDLDTAPDDGNTTTVATDELVRYHSEGSKLVRSILGDEAGETVAVEGPPEWMSDVQPGDDVVLTPLNAASPSHDDLGVKSVQAFYRRRQRPTRAVLMCEDL